MYFYSIDGQAKRKGWSVLWGDGRLRCVWGLDNKARKHLTVLMKTSMLSGFSISFLINFQVTKKQSEMNEMHADLECLS